MAAKMAYTLHITRDDLIRITAAMEVQKHTCEEAYRISGDKESHKASVNLGETLDKIYKQRDFQESKSK